MEPEEQERREEELPIPRAVQLRRTDLEKHGLTRDCPGCRAVLRGAPRMPHSAACRKRMTEAMAGDPRIKRAEAKKNEFLDKALDREDRKRKEKEEEGKRRRVEEERKAQRAERGDEAMGEQDDEMVGGRPAGESGAAQDRSEGSSSRNREGGRPPGEVTGDGSEGPSERTAGGHCSEGNRKRQAWADIEDDEEDLQETKRQMIDLVWLAGAVNQEESEEVPEAVWRDDPVGEELDPEKLKAGIKDEMDFMEKIGMFEDATEQECWERTGAAPTSTRWVHGKKLLDSGEDIVRARLVGRDFNTGRGTREDLFAATPPLEGLKLLFRAAMVREEGEEETKLMFIDVRKAHLIPRCEEDVYVRLPEEFGFKVVKLRRWLYGMRKAANRWEDHYTRKLREAGFIQGVASPVVFYNPVTSVRCVVHGDDFTFSGRHRELEAVRRWIKGWCDIKFRGIMGSGEEDVKEREVLGRIIRRTREGLEVEADEKHRRVLMEKCDLVDESNCALEPMVVQGSGSGGRADGRPPDAEIDDDGGGELGPKEATWYRGMVARANYLAQDRMDIQFAAKELSRRMARPRKEDVGKLKRFVRYLVGAERMVQLYPEMKKMPSVVEAFGDSDWAACKVSRRSTSGGVILFGGSALKTYSSTQGSVATSVGEAEYYAALKAAAEGLGVQALARDLGIEVEVRLRSNSTSAQGIAGRRGFSSRTRHMETKYLWLQEAVARKRLGWEKVHTSLNPADLLTKVKSRVEAVRLSALAGCQLHVRQADDAARRRGGVGRQAP